MDPYNPHRPNPQQGYSPYQAYPGFNQPNNNMNPNNMGAPRSYGTYTTQSFPQNTLQPSAYASNVSTNTGNSQHTDVSQEACISS